jgi:hypothetical protein
VTLRLVIIAQCNTKCHRIVAQVEYPDDLVGDVYDDSDGKDYRNHRANYWRDSRRRPTGSRDDYAHSIRPSGKNDFARDEMYA